MTITLNHTIVYSHDKQESATFLAEILGVSLPAQWGHFQPVPLDNEIVLEYLEVGEADVRSQHYAFLVSDDVFDAAFAMIEEKGITYWADPFHHRPGEINHNYGARGVYFFDPSGHNMELMTAPYGDTPEG